ncbi:hypothetical protein GCM10023083_81240 [Streptomyces phyllanthi]
MSGRATATGKPGKGLPAAARPITDVLLLGGNHMSVARRIASVSAAFAFGFATVATATADAQAANSAVQRVQSGGGDGAGWDYVLASGGDGAGWD